MKRFKNILVLYNNLGGDEIALRDATAQAQLNGAKLTICSIVNSAWNGIDRKPITRTIDQQGHTLDHIARSIRAKHGVYVDKLILMDDPAEGILETVREKAIDLIMLSSEYASVKPDFFKPSLKVQLMRESSVPVWVTRNDGRPYRNILACIDLKADGPESQLLNRAILEISSSLADRVGAMNHILYAWDYEGPDIDTSQSEITQSMLANLKSKYESRFRKQILTLKGDSDFEALHLPQGDPVEHITRVTTEHSIDLIIMGMEGRNGVLSLMKPNTSEEVVTTVECPIMSVTPAAVQAAAKALELVS